jgi:hypothetical protein
LCNSGLSAEEILAIICSGKYSKDGLNSGGFTYPAELHDLYIKEIEHALPIYQLIVAAESVCSDY